MNPDPDMVSKLRTSLEEANMGVVAHYYMDVELQSILNSVGGDSQRVAIADSLAMGDHAVRMVKDMNVKAIVFLCFSRNTINQFRFYNDSRKLIV